MSLINKMLQDLDARGAQGGEPASDAVRPVPHEGRKARVLIVVLGAAVVAGAVGAMLIGFRLMGVTPAPPAPAVLATAAPAAARAPVAKPAPAPLSAPAAPAAAAVPEPGAPAPVDPGTASAPAAPGSPEAPASRETPVKAETPVPVPTAAPQRAQPSASAPALAAMRAEAEQEGAKDASRREPAPVRQPRASMTAEAAASKAAVPTAREPLTQPDSKLNTPLTTQQRAENQYRRALDSLQEGRTTEALERLQQALEIEPRHQAARETLVRLLLESNREEDAMRQLQQALDRDAAQPAMAMMLARLQLEKTGPSGPAIDTLTRSLPSAAGNADYLAFLAALLQRGQRYADSSAYYRQALRLAPQNGVWWMGLGISLQADGKAAEAGEAYARARASGNLTPELQAFVDRKLQQLGH